MAWLGMADPTTYRQAIRSSVGLYYSVDARLGGAPIRMGLRPTGGTISDTTKPGVRRALNLELAPEPGLFEALTPVGTTLTVTAHVKLTNGSLVDIPMGVFDVDSERISEGGGALSLTAPDKWVRIQRARFVGPAASYPNVSVITQLVQMIRDAFNPNEPVAIYATRNAPMPATVWEKDRSQAMIDLAASIGAWVYFDRNGIATIADIPTVGATADWLVDADGVLTSLGRERSRTSTYNVVRVSSSASDGEKFASVVVWDDDPASPTFAGTDPPLASNAGPFGVSTYFYDSPIIDSDYAARETGRTILARVTGLASSVNLGMAPNPAVDAFDVIDVQGPIPWRTALDSYTSTGDGFGTGPFGTSPFGAGTGSVPVLKRIPGAPIERHVCDTVTHPLTVGGGNAQQIDGRSTRYEEIEGGS